jgi:hypothetical protein
LRSVPASPRRRTAVAISILPEVRHWRVPRVWRCWLPGKGRVRRISARVERNRAITIMMMIMITRRMIPSAGRGERCRAFGGSRRYGAGGARSGGTALRALTPLLFVSGGCAADRPRRCALEPTSQGGRSAACPRLVTHAPSGRGENAHQPNFVNFAVNYFDPPKTTS